MKDAFAKTKLLIILFTASMVTLGVAQNLDSIKIELEQDYRTSLLLRQRVMPTINTFGHESKQMDSLNSAIVSFDSIALIRTIDTIERYGWLGKSEIGSIGNHALFQNIQHAKDNKIRERYYPLLEKSVANGQSNAFDMATMKDRILVQNGEMQIYGTQRDREGKYFPIADVEGLNKRRKKVGLGRLRLSKEDVKVM